MNVASIEFLLSVLAASALFFHLPPGRARRVALAAANAAFLALLIPNAASALALALVLVSGYGVALSLRAHPRRAVLALYLAVLIGAFLVLQKYAFLEALLPASIRHHPLNVVGLSYILFRQIHFLVDAMQGQIEAPTFWGYLNYQLNLLALLAGPIQRFQEFQDYWRDPRPRLPDRHALLMAWLRILIGLVKIAAVGALLLQAHDRFLAQLADSALTVQGAGRTGILLRVAVVLYAYPAYIYFNFSGYCDIVIGAGALFGQRLPENFDRPHLSRNVLDFWTRFHRTLGFWVRDYLFMPMYKGIAEWSSRWAPSLAFLCYFAAFFLAGIWHGATPGFAVFGLLQGAGASAAKLWEMAITRRSGRAGLRRYLESRPIRFAAIVGTLHYYALSVLFFFPGSLWDCILPLRLLGRALVPAGWLP
jgi:membrane protein involved in D-alanine export